MSSSETAPVNTSRWKADRIALRRLSETVVLSSGPPPASEPKVYEYLGLRLFTNFITQLDVPDRARFNNEGAAHGFKIVARLLQPAPEAYRDFTTATQTTPDLLELARILGRSDDTPNFFARMPEDEDNDIFETVFCLKEKSVIRRNKPFVITPSDQGPLYIPNPDLVDKTFANYRGRLKLPSTDHPPRPGEFCPGLGRFLTKVWREGVVVCVSVPDFFPRELGLQPLSPQLVNEAVGLAV